MRASHASRAAWNETVNTARPSRPSRNPVFTKFASFTDAEPTSEPESTSKSSPPANTDMGMKSFQPRLVVSPPSASPAKRPYESRCTLFLPSVWCTAETRKTSQHDRLAATPDPGDKSPATFDTRAASPPSPILPPAPSAAVRAESAPCLSPLIVSISLLSRHSDRHSENCASSAEKSSASSLTFFFLAPAALWYALSRNAQSPTTNDGDMTFCVLIITAKCLKFSIVHVNRPVKLTGGEISALRDASPEGEGAAPFRLASASTTSSEDSFKKTIRASTTSASSTRYPFFGSSTTALRAKSHQPCDFLRLLNLCQLSRRAPASGTASPPARRGSIEASVGRTTASS